jgi:hypothetical protein
MGKGIAFSLILASLLMVSCTKRATDSKFACQCYYEDSKGVTQYPVHILITPSRDSAAKACATWDYNVKSWYGHTSSACYLN